MVHDGKSRYSRPLSVPKERNKLRELTTLKPMHHCSVDHRLLEKGEKENLVWFAPESPCLLTIPH
ncbi:hypothetical protein ACHAXS_001170 [Conticribra weissflogii]